MHTFITISSLRRHLQLLSASAVGLALPGLLALPLVACGEDPAPTAKADATIDSTADSGGDTTDTLPWQVQSLGSGLATATVNGNDGTIVLGGEGQQQRLAVADLVWGRGTWNVEHAFGAFKFAQAAQSNWQAAKSLRITAVLPVGSGSQAGGAAPRQPAAEVQFDVLDGALAVLAKGKLTAEDNGVRLRLQAVDRTLTQAQVAYNAEPGEHFLGLGGQSFDVDHRGQRARLWVQEDGIGKFDAGDDDYSLWPLFGRRYTTHTPMPVYLSSRNLGVILWSDHAVTVDVAKTSTSQVVWINEQPDLDLQWTFGSSPQQVVTQLTAALGRPKTPPLFAFAPWLDAIYGRDNVLRIANKLRDLQIPVAALWTEDWRGGEQSGPEYTLDEDWRADAKLYPDFAGMTKQLHDLGYKFLTYNNTFLTQDADIWEESTTNGHAIKKADGSVYAFNTAKFVPASLVDLTRPETLTWAKAVYKEGLDLGADGWMADFCEWLPTDAVLHGGSGWDWHQRYPVLCQQVNQELFDEVGKDGVERLYFVRSGWLGSQSKVSVVWAGDQQTDFSEGDGLPSVIPMGIGLGITGFPFYGHDIAGYASVGTDFTSKELWWRWVTFGALSPVMRTHHGKSAQGNWNWESDETTTQVLKRWARVHMQLVPYLYELAAQVPTDGLPLFRALALQYPAFAAGWTTKDQYVLGDRIVVAPVIEQGATSRQVTLPDGMWYPLLGGELLASKGVAQTVQAPLSEIPAFVAAGTVLVLWPDGQQTTEPNSRSTKKRTPDDVTTAREVWLWPGAPKGSATDVGQAKDGTRTFGWQPGAWDGSCKAVTWNGQTVTATAGVVNVSGAGTLVLDGVGTLQVQGHTGELRVVCANLRPAPTPIAP